MDDVGLACPDRMFDESAMSAPFNCAALGENGVAGNQETMHKVLTDTISLYWPISTNPSERSLPIIQDSPISFESKVARRAAPTARR
jgi:hypothetical protein